MPGRQPTAELLHLLTPPLRDRGVDVEDVEVASVGRRKLVRVLVDKDGGVTLDDVADATTVVGQLLDSSDVFDDAPYTLEVTSPGVDRPLTEPRHWRRNFDRLVVVQLVDGSSCTGRIVEAGDSAAFVDVGGSRRSIRYADVTKARVEIEFNRPGPASDAAAQADGAGAVSGDTGDTDAASREG
jgi:ribosome maturation factor RimP